MKIDVSRISDWWEEINREEQVGDIKIKSRFLLFPKTINGELRWLEKASWEEEYVRETFRGFDNHVYMRFCWRKNEWL